MSLACALLAIAALGSTGCRYLLDEPASPVDEPAPDAAAPDGEVVDLCGFGAGVLDVDGFCLAAPPEPMLQLTGPLDTEDGTRCLAIDAGGDYCVLAARDVVVSGLTVTGARPLILVATSRLEVVGPLDAAATLATPRPTPGARRCGDGELGAEASGAPGGSFGSIGGPGGVKAGPGASGARAGAVVALSPPSALRGGCAGEARGNQGGAGGGAVYLVAREAIQIASTIDASGAPGLGGTTQQDGTGGEGGGSGGMIVLDAPAIALGGGASVTAFGGGGGEGGGGQSTGSPGDGSSGGTLGAARGGDGGDGAALAAAARAGDDGDASGGGGGGGFGVIWLRGAVTGDATISPPARVLE